MARQKIAVRKRRRTAEKQPWVDLREPPAEGGWKIGYARVSMSDQSNERQIDELNRYGCHRVYYDTGTGSHMNRVGWRACDKDLRDFDELAVVDLDRLGRRLTEVISTVQELSDRGVRLRVLKHDLDMSSPMGKMMLHVFALIAEWELNMIRDRTIRGLESAKRRGVRLGAKPMYPDEVILDAAKEHGVNQAFTKLSKFKSRSGYMKALKAARDRAETRRLQRAERK